MIDIITGTAFSAPKRLNHRDDEVALEFPSSVGSRVRNLLALRGMMWSAAGNSEEKMYKELFHTMVMGYYQNRGGTAIRDIMPDIVDDTIINVRPYAFQHCCIGNVSLPNCTRIEANGFYGAWSGSASAGEGKVVNMPKVTTFGGNFPFQGLAGGSEVHLDSLTSLSQNSITGSSYYIAWFFPKVTSITASNWNYASSWRELHLDSMTMDDVMASPGWPWGGMLTPGYGYPKGVCYCSDGYITYENGAWTKHPN